MELLRGADNASGAFHCAIATRWPRSDWTCVAFALPLSHDLNGDVAMRTAISVFATTLIVAVSAYDVRAQTNDEPVSQCLAIAQNLDMARVWYAAQTASPLDTVREDDSVTFTFEGHSTWRIVTPAGVHIATDFSGFYGSDPLPRIVTMNRAHSSHYTLTPDPDIEYVFTGWNPDGPGPIDHDTVVDDVYVRNVTTDIRSWGDRDGMIADANSIFIFETAALCIGHLGHLHHPLTEDHYAQIGRLDVLMVPVDGGLTLSHSGMSELAERLRSSVLLPMHLRGRSIQSFVSMLGDDWQAEYLEDDTLSINIRALPKLPTVYIPAGLAIRG